MKVDTTKSSPRILGVGLLCLDIIRYADTIHYCAGGSCGNIISSLAYMGCDSTLLSWPSSDLAYEIINHNLSQVGVKQIFFEESSSLTPRIIENLTFNEDKYYSHDFLFCCPNCGKKLPRLKKPRVKDIETLLTSFSDYDVLYYDRISPGIKYLNSKFKHNKKWVIYEPNSSRNQIAFIKNSLTSNIVKFSHEKVSMQLADNLRKVSSDSDIILIVQTMGEQGLRFSYRKRNNQLSKWINIPPQPVSKLIDTVGAGDWCTSGLISSLLSNTRSCPKWFKKDELVAALQYGQALAAISCSFIGAQGLLYADPSKDEISLFRDRIKPKRSKIRGYSLSKLISSNLCQTCLLPI